MYFGNTGVYVSSLLAGLVDVDAITLSMAELGGAAGGTGLGVAARAIVLAALSDTLVKTGVVLSLGATSLRRALLRICAILLVLGIGMALVPM